MLSGVQTGTPAPLIADDVWEVIEKNSEVLDAAIVHERDYE